jgi:hypothetical protein
MSISINESDRANGKLSPDDISGVLDALFSGVRIEETPAQREFSIFIRNWCRAQMKRDIHRGLVIKTRSDIQDLLAAAEPDDTELHCIIKGEVIIMRDSLRCQLL